MTFVPGNAAGLVAEFGSPVCNKNHFIARLLSTLGVGGHAKAATQLMS